MSKLMKFMFFVGSTILAIIIIGMPFLFLLFKNKNKIDTIILTTYYWVFIGVPCSNLLKQQIKTFRNIKEVVLK